MREQGKKVEWAGGKNRGWGPGSVMRRDKQLMSRGNVCMYLGQFLLGEPSSSEGLLHPLNGDVSKECL